MVKQIDKWSKFATIRMADGKTGYEITAGVNSYGDGPDRTVCRVFDVSLADLKIIEASAAMLNALRKLEYWLDISEEEYSFMPEVDAISHRANLEIVRDAIRQAQS